MTKRALGIGTIILAAAFAAPAHAGTPQAAPTLRHGATVHGGVRVIGNTLGYDCGRSAQNPPPAGTTVDCTGNLFTSDSSPDVYWQDDTANALILGPNARTSAALQVPAGATIEHARLYWGGRRLALLADTTATLELVGGNMMSFDADDTWDLTILGSQESYYQATADVTAFVQASGPGEYRASSVDAILLPNIQQDITYSGWALVVVFDKPGLPRAQIRVLDGFDELGAPASENRMLASIDAALAFTVPKSPVHHVHLGLLGWEGDIDTTGDSLSWNGTALSNASNPADNVFNSTRSIDGISASNASDQPPLSGDPGSMAGFDLDVFDVSALVANTDTSATVTAAVVNDPTSGAPDTVFLGALVLEVNGCLAAVDCTNPAKPACDSLSGDCQICTLPGGGGDPGTCTTSNDGHRCEDGGGGTVFCGCDTQADCPTPQMCDMATHKCVAPCMDDGDCMNPTPICDTGTGQCVGCMGNSDCMDPTPICDMPTHSCVQCEMDADCSDPTPHCDPGNKQCVQCVTNDQCPNGQMCDNGTCTSGSGGGGSGNGGSGGSGTSTSTSTSSNSGGGGASGTSTSSMGSSAGGADTNGVIIEGGGCACAVAGGERSMTAFGLAALALSALGLRRRRRR